MLLSPSLATHEPACNYNRTNGTTIVPFRNIYSTAVYLRYGNKRYSFFRTHTIRYPRVPIPEAELAMDVAHPQHEHRTTAMCVCGELRTFGVAAVHSSIAMLARRNHADLLFFTTPAQTHCLLKPREQLKATRCADSHRAIRELIASAPPSQIVYWRNVTPHCATGCAGHTAGTAYAPLRQCLLHALQQRRYRWIVRVRPDFFFLPSALPAPLPLDLGSSAGSSADDVPELRVASGDVNADMFFSVNAAGASLLLALGKPLEPPRCGFAARPGSRTADFWPVDRSAECCLDVMHPLLALAAHHAGLGEKGACDDHALRAHPGVAAPWRRLQAMLMSDIYGNAAEVRRWMLPVKWKLGAEPPGGSASGSSPSNLTCAAWMAEGIRLGAHADVVGGLLRTPHDLRVAGGTLSAALTRGGGVNLTRSREANMARLAEYLARRPMREFSCDTEEHAAHQAAGTGMPSSTNTSAGSAEVRLY